MTKDMRKTIGLSCLIAIAFRADLLPAYTDPEPGITGIYVDVANIHHDPLSNGDTWDYAWADDDNIYTFSDDSRGYTTGQWRNLQLSELNGPTWDAVVGKSVNTMDDYGSGSQQFPNGASWKSTGCTSIDGVLYAFVAPNWYGDHNAYGGDHVDPYLRQTVLDMSLIKSTDHGKTWTRSESQNYGHPMWTSYKFSTAYFFKFGKDGGNVIKDEANKYVYAISNDGFWDDGTNLYLGRVKRSKIAALDPKDWQFYDNATWTTNIDDASPIPGFPNGLVKCSCGSPIWLAPIGKYVSVTWYNPEPADTRLKWDYPRDRVFDFYQADHPWGPWSIVGEIKASDFIADPDSPVHRWYGPSLSPKFITSNPDHSVTAILTFSGQTWEDDPRSLYKNNSCPVTFYTTPRPRQMLWVNDSDPDIDYSDGWSYLANYGQGDYRGDEHRSTTPDSTISFRFTGSGIEILSAKSSDLGKIEVKVDGISRGLFNEYQTPMPRLYKVPIYRNLNLAEGIHTVVIVNRSMDTSPVTFDGYRTYSNGGAATVQEVNSSAPRYEAEAGIYGSTQVYNDANASGGVGTCKLDVVIGSGVRFSNVNAGTKLTIRYCTAYDQGKLTLYINGDKSQDIVFPSTGAWASSYNTLTVPVAIPAGANLRLQYDQGDSATNIDYITIH